MLGCCLSSWCRRLVLVLAHQQLASVCCFWILELRLLRKCLCAPDLALMRCPSSCISSHPCGLFRVASKAVADLVWFSSRSVSRFSSLKVCGACGRLLLVRILRNPGGNCGTASMTEDFLRFLLPDLRARSTRGSSPVAIKEPIVNSNGAEAGAAVFGSCRRVPMIGAHLCSVTCWKTRLKISIPDRICGVASARFAMEF